MRIDRAPQRPSLRQELFVGITPDFGEPLERKSSCFADPRAQYDLVTKRGGSFVVNFMSENDPADRVLCFRAGDRMPMRSGNILNPPQIDGVVHVILLVDVACAN